MALGDGTEVGRAVILAAAVMAAVVTTGGGGEVCRIRQSTAMWTAGEKTFLAPRLGVERMPVQLNQRREVFSRPRKPVSKL